jgi:hypothetical protein
MLFLSPAVCADGSIDVIPDENINGSVELTPGYIAGVVDIGGQTVNRIDLTAKGGDYSAKAYLAAEGPYERIVNVPKGDSLGYTLNGMAWMDSYNTRLWFKERSTVVEEAKTSTVNIIIDAGTIAGAVTTDGCGVVQGELWAVLDTEAGFTRAYTRFGADGTFRFPVQPNSGIRVYGQVQLSGGATYRLQEKFVDVAPADETVVGWHFDCGRASPPPSIMRSITILTWITITPISTTRAPRHRIKQSVTTAASYSTTSPPAIGACIPTATGTTGKT